MALRGASDPAWEARFARVALSAVAADGGDGEGASNGGTVSYRCVHTAVSFLRPSNPNPSHARRSINSTQPPTHKPPNPNSALFADDAGLVLLSPALWSLPALLHPVLQLVLRDGRSPLAQALLEALLTSVQRQLVLAAAAGAHGAAVWGAEVRLSVVAAVVTRGGRS